MKTQTKIFKVEVPEEREINSEVIAECLQDYYCSSAEVTELTSLRLDGDKNKVKLLKKIDKLCLEHTSDYYLALPQLILDECISALSLSSDEKGVEIEKGGDGAMHRCPSCNHIPITNRDSYCGGCGSKIQWK